MSGVNYRLLTTVIFLLVICGSAVSVISIFYSPFKGWDLPPLDDDENQITVFRQIVVQILTAIGALSLLPVTSSSMFINEQRKWLLIPLPCTMLVWSASSIIDIVAIVKKEETILVDEEWLDYVAIMVLGIGNFIRLMYVIIIAYYYDYLKLFAHAHSTEAALKPLSLRDRKMHLSHIELKRLTYGPEMEDELSKLFSKDIGLGFPLLRLQRGNSRKSMMSKVEQLTEIAE